MPRIRPVADLTDLVYQPVSELIKFEALKVSKNCITKFHIDDDVEMNDIMDESMNQMEDIETNRPSLNDEGNPNNPHPLLTLEEHVRKRYA